LQLRTPLIRIGSGAGSRAIRLVYAGLPWPHAHRGGALGRRASPPAGSLTQCVMPVSPGARPGHRGRAADPGGAPGRRCRGCTLGGDVPPAHRDVDRLRINSSRSLRDANAPWLAGEPPPLGLRAAATPLDHARALRLCGVRDCRRAPGRVALRPRRDVPDCRTGARAGLVVCIRCR
jgi:hypothetical protein